jgi:hypothetical protein
LFGMLIGGVSLVAVLAAAPARGALPPG